MTMAAARCGMFGPAEASENQSRELAAVGRATEWLNSQPLTAASLLGKVVLVDFCTYTCINWLRTLPYIRAWSQKYRQGAVVIGVHTPEFEFEKNIDNVRRAVKEMRIEYPIVIDNDYAIWRAFGNQYWPALYFIDGRGRVRDRHFGEGEHERSEKTIQRLLVDAGSGGVDNNLVQVQGTGIEAAADWSNLRSPENYVGYDRTEQFASGGVARDKRRLYSARSRLSLNQWALGGEWTIGRQVITLNTSPGRIVTRFHARDLHLVMGPPRRDSPIRVRVSLDGQPPGTAHGANVDDRGNGMVVDQRLYQLIRQPTPIVDRTCEIEFLDAGVEALALTFG